MQGIDIDDAEMRRAGFDLGTDINATATTNQKIGDPQTEAIALQRAGAMLVKFNSAGRVRCRQRRMRPTETTLARSYGPRRRGKARTIEESNGSAVAGAAIDRGFKFHGWVAKRPGAHSGRNALPDSRSLGDGIDRHGHFPRSGAVQRPLSLVMAYYPEPSARWAEPPAARTARNALARSMSPATRQPIGLAGPPGASSHFARDLPLRERPERAGFFGFGSAMSKVVSTMSS